MAVRPARNRKMFEVGQRLEPAAVRAAGRGERNSSRQVLPDEGSAAYSPLDPAGAVRRGYLSKKPHTSLDIRTSRAVTPGSFHVWLTPDAPSASIIDGCLLSATGLRRFVHTLRRRLQDELAPVPSRLLNLASPALSHRRDGEAMTKQITGLDEQVYRRKAFVFLLRR